MHEMAVTKGIFNMVMQEMEKNNASKVCKISLKMGGACDYYPEIIQDYYDIISEDTKAFGAKIEVEILDITMLCTDCGKTYTTKRYNPFCPNCSSRKTTMKSGTECYIESIEIED